MFRFPGFSENREIHKSGKKASDVEFVYVEFPLRNMVITNCEDCQTLSEILLAEYTAASMLRRSPHNRSLAPLGFGISMAIQNI